MSSVPQEAQGPSPLTAASAEVDGARARLARFHALRRKTFAEMGRQGARMRLLWVVPFQALVLVLLLVRGLSGARGLVFAAAMCTGFGIFTYQALRTRVCPSVATLMLGFGSYLASLAVTGGLASPLIPMGVPMLVAAAVVLEGSRARTVFLAYVVASVMALALLSRTSLGAIIAPLAPADGWASPEYVVVAAASLVFTAFSVSKYGRHLATTYEKIAFELAERREEICTEGEDRTRALEGMAARLAHEVKNPLAAIKGLSVHMARSASDPKIAERLSIVAAEADRLQAIVDGFLSFSRGLDELQTAPTKPYELARELALLLETRASDAGVTLEVTGDPETTIDVDPRKLRQALLNLVLNAMQASPSGQKVTLHVERQCPMTRAAKIRVVDRGAGMSPEILDRIRKPYFTTREGGSGLGVAVARGLIEQHGGTVEYDSAPGGGTTVTIQLPAQPLASVDKLPKVACGPAECARALLAKPADGEPAKSTGEAKPTAPAAAKA